MRSTTICAIISFPFVFLTGCNASTGEPPRAVYSLSFRGTASPYLLNTETGELWETGEHGWQLRDPAVSLSEPRHAKYVLNASENAGLWLLDTETGELWNESPTKGWALAAKPPQHPATAPSGH